MVGSVGDTGALPAAIRQVGDPSADGLIDELARTEQIRAVSRILRHLVDNDQPLPDDVPASLAEWLGRTGEVPAWADHERLERGCGGRSPSCSRARTTTAGGASWPTLTATRRWPAAARAWRRSLGLVLTGLIDAGEASSDAVRRGVAYLLDQQQPDGGWLHGDWLQAIVPPDTFYILAEAASTIRSRRSPAGSRPPEAPATYKAGPPLYSSSVTCSPQVTVLPVSSTS